MDLISNNFKMDTNNGLTLTSLLMMGLFLIFLALSAYLNVDKVSSTLVSAGLTQAIIRVYELPPRES